MTISHTISKGFSRTGETINRSATQSSGEEHNVDEAIPALSTDLAVAFAVVVAKIKSFYITSDVACTVKTNSTSSPGKTFTLAADQAIDWQADDPIAAASFFGADITVLYVTAVAAAALKIRCLCDPT